MIQTDERLIRVFISSTFRDMQGEREYLIDKVFPVLREVAAKRDVMVVPVDLRWGITDEEAESGKVIQICLQEIENSRPFFIGLLGDRYGWCPSFEEISSNRALVEAYPFLLDDARNGLSITEIEMQYGVLRSEEKIDAYFYIKGEENAEENEKDKLHALKKAVVDDGRYPVHKYSSVEDLGARIQQDFMALLDRLYPDRELTRLQKERLAQASFLRSRTNVYIPVEENFKRLDDFLKGEELHLVVTGDSGMGKSALIANWIKRHENDGDRNFIYHFVGNGNQESNHTGILIHLCDEICDLYGIEGYDISTVSPEHDLKELFGMIAGGKPLVIVVDGINKLAEIGTAKLMNWFPEPGPEVKVLFSTHPDDGTMFILESRGYPILYWNPLPQEGRIRFIKEYLGFYRKSLSCRQVEMIASDPQSLNTSVLKALLNELVCFGEHERIDEKIDYYLCAENIEDFHERILKRFEDSYGKEIVGMVLSMIAFSYRGLSENEIIGISRLPVLKWSQFYSAFKYNFVTVQGRIVFSDDQMKKTVLSRYADAEVFVRRRIVEYFDFQLSSDRRQEELPYQAYRLGDYERLYDLISTLYVGAHWCYLDGHQLVEFWTKLMELDKEKYSPDIYLSDSARDEFLLNPDNDPEFYIVTLFLLIFFIETHFASQERSEKIVSTLKGILESIPEVAEDASTFLAIYSARKGIKTAATSDNIDGDLSYYCKALEYFTSREYDKAREYADKYLDYLNNHDGSMEEKANAYMMLSSICIQIKEYGEAWMYAEYIYNEAMPVLGPGNYAVLFNLMNIGRLFYYDGLYKEAEEYLLMAEELTRAAYGDTCDIDIQSYHILGEISRKRGDSEKAIYYYNESLRIAKVILGENNDVAANNHNGLGLAYFKVKDYEKALASFKRSAEIFISVYGSKSLSEAQVYRNLGDVYSSLKEYRNAAAYYEKCKEILMDKYGKFNMKIAECMDLLAESYYANNDFENASEHYHQALDIKGSLNAKDALQFIEQYSEKFFHIAGLLVETSPRKALDCYQRLLYHFMKIDRQDHPIADNLLNIIINLADDYPDL